MRLIPFLFLIILSISSSCNEQVKSNYQPVAKHEIQDTVAEKKQFMTGAEQLDTYLPLLEGKRVAIAANQTSMIGDEHIVDRLLKEKVNIVQIFSPEHGFRGKADAGEKVSDNIDAQTGLPIISLYGKNRKPKPEYLDSVDVVLFDIQDVGVRFYTYISTLHYIMEACGETGKSVIVLDRPNPNGHYVDGPVLKDEKAKSFVGIHPIPLVHGMTIGEFAQMVNGEKWLKGGVTCDLTVIPCAEYTHDMPYSLPVKPSPNLPNDLSIALYPALGLFEGTNVSVGRGTDIPFQLIGSPYIKNGDTTFVPRSIDGASKYPPHLGKECYGFDLRSDSLPFTIDKNRLNIEIVIYMYKNTESKQVFFNNFFYNLAGTKQLRKQIEEGKSADEIRQTWVDDLDTFKTIRKKYLLYK